MVRGLRQRTRFGVLALVAAALAAPAGAQAAPCGLPGPPDESTSTAATVTGQFDSSQEGAYAYLPVTVPAGTTAVRVRYCHDQPELVPPSPAPNAPKHVLDLGLYEARPDPEETWGMDQLRGSSGSSVRDVAVAPNGFTSDATYEADRKAYVPGHTTRAYRPGPIPAGEWAVELGLAAIASQSELDADGKVEWKVQVELSGDGLWSDVPYAPTPYDATSADTEQRWYAGDFHVHGEHEPGNATMRETFDYAFAPYGGEGAGLDFVTLVDHNNVVAYDEVGRYQPDYPGKLIVRSTEVTTFRGHLQNHASGQAVDYRTGPLLEATLADAGGTDRTVAGLTERRGPRPASEVFDEIHAAGGFTQINHPTIFPGEVPTFDDFCRGCAWGYDPGETGYERVDAIEIATGPAGLHVQPNPGPNPFTTTAIRFYEDAIDQGGANANQIAAVGSSDSHQAPKRSELDPAANAFDAPIGMATTMVFADELSEAGIREAVRANRTFVKVWGADGPDLRLEASAPGSPDPPAMIGDTLEAESAGFTARVLGLDDAMAARPGAYALVVVRDGDPLLAVPIPPGQDEFQLDFPSLGHARYGLMVSRTATGVASVEAYSSPIWLEPESGEPPPPPPPDCAVALKGSDGADTFTGTDESDAFRGRGGGEEIGGREANDCLAGGRSRDRVDGGPGEDELRGGRGRDRLEAADGEPDDVHCGRGRDDRAVVDALDSVHGCERLR